MPDKDSIRKQLLKERHSLDDSSAKNLSHFIQESVISSNVYMNSRNLAVYSPIQNEVATDKIVANALLANKNVCFPTWEPEHSIIHFFQVHDTEQLKPTAWGTLEPDARTHDEVSRYELDLIIVPGVVFDRRGYRLGYGHGGYDRVLAGLSTRALGLAYEFQIVDRLPVEPHDVPCTHVVTEMNLIEVPL